MAYGYLLTTQLFSLKTNKTYSLTISYKLGQIARSQLFSVYHNKSIEEDMKSPRQNRPPGLGQVLAQIKVYHPTFMTVPI